MARHRATPESHDDRSRRIVEQLRSHVWLLPVVFVAAAVAAGWAMVWIDERIQDPPMSALAFRGTIADGQTLLTTIATAMLTFMGVVFSISVLALQLASNQFSPRVLRTFMRDLSSQLVLGTFCATFVYSIVVLGAIRADGGATDAVATRLSVSIAFLLVVLSLLAFLFYVHHMSNSVRAVSIIEAVARETRSAIADNYPRGEAPTDSNGGGDEAEKQRRQALSGHSVSSEVCFEHAPGVLAAVEIETLVEVAARHDCLIEIVPRIGEYLPRGVLLARVHGSADPPSREVLSTLDIQSERTMYQDPAFGFRQLVDIAEKALSPALNDPTTAVQVIHRLFEHLLDLSSRPIPSGVYHDAEGVPRVVRRVTDWPEFVAMAFEEIRDYGTKSIQVCRRMRAAIDALVEAAPPDRRQPLLRQRELLDRAVARDFPDEAERLTARETDAIGLGG